SHARRLCHHPREKRELLQILRWRTGIMRPFAETVETKPFGKTGLRTKLLEPDGDIVMGIELTPHHQAEFHDVRTPGYAAGLRFRSRSDLVLLWKRHHILLHGRSRNPAE